MTDGQTDGQTDRTAISISRVSVLVTHTKLKAHRCEARALVVSQV